MPVRLCTVRLCCRIVYSSYYSTVYSHVVTSQSKSQICSCFLQWPLCSCIYIHLCTHPGCCSKSLSVSSGSGSEVSTDILSRQSRKRPYKGKMICSSPQDTEEGIVFILTQRDPCMHHMYTSHAMHAHDIVVHKHIYAHACMHAQNTSD